MRTFDARIEPRLFWAWLAVPPLVYWIVVEGIVKGGYGGQVSPLAFVGLLAMANGFPLAALAWTICSVAAYSIAPGRLIVHRAIGDREFRLGELQGTPEVRGNDVRLVWPNRTLTVRPTDVAGCLQELRIATGTDQSALSSRPGSR